MNWEQIKAWLEENKSLPEVIAFFAVLKQLTPDEVSKFLETEDGKKVLQPKLDGHFSKSLDTWKTNNLEKLIDEEVKKRHPSKTPEQIELEKLRAEINNEKRERVKAELRNKLAGVLTEKKLPMSVLNRLTSETEEDAIKEIDAYAADFETYAKAEVERVMKENGRDPNRGGGGGQVNPWKAETFNLTEQGKILRENPQLAEQLKAAAAGK